MNKGIIKRHEVDDGLQEFVNKVTSGLLKIQAGNFDLKYLTYLMEKNSLSTEKEDSYLIIAYLADKLGHDYKEAIKNKVLEDFKEHIAGDLEKKVGWLAKRDGNDEYTKAYNDFSNRLQSKLDSFLNSWI